MFEKCIKCERLGTSCAPNLMVLPFQDLLQWCSKRQKYLEWTNQELADHSTVPVGTINRIKAGDYMDCKYSTIRNILIALMGGTTNEFPCTEQLAELEKQAAKCLAVEKENEALRCRLEDCREIIGFLKDEVKAWRTVHQK